MALHPRATCDESFALQNITWVTACGSSMESVALTLTKQRESEARKAKAKAKAAIGTTRTKGVFKGKVVAREEVPRRKRATLAAGTVKLPAAGGVDNVLITSALPYVNNVPHLGNLIGCVLSADVYARWCRRRPGKNVIYICGTDEYGTATEMKAIAEGVTPRAICDKYHAIHKGVYDWFDIEFDYFGRTSHETPASSAGWAQTEIAQEMFHGLDRAGLVKKDDVHQVYCSGCTRFLADRFVSGICPKCGYDDARGDQCDSCGKLLNATELLEPRCSVDASHSVGVRSSTHLFLDLPAMRHELQELMEARAKTGQWSPNCVAVTRSWIRDGLQTRCITRDLTWGTPVPREGFEDKVFYVWYDAPIGYMSMTANYTGGYESEGWRRWWQPTADCPVRLAQFMGKDNIPFHSVIFPASLMGSKEGGAEAAKSPVAGVSPGGGAAAAAAASGAGDAAAGAPDKSRPWLVVNEMSTTEYLQYEDGRFSKSRGVGVFGDNAKDTGVAADVWRFYLLSVRPETADTAFSWNDLAARNNSMLLANLGNFINRALRLCGKQGSKVPTITPSLFGEAEAVLFAAVDSGLAEFNAALEARQLREGTNIAMRISAAGNIYVQTTQPWELTKAGKTAEADNVIALAVNLVHLLAVVFEPYMPAIADKVCHLLDADHLAFIPDAFARDGTLSAGHAIREAVPLFSPIEETDVAAWRARFGGLEAPSGGSAAGAAAASASTGKAKQKKQQKGKGGGGKGDAAAAGAKGSGPPFSRVDMRVGRIVRAWEHPDADKLFCEEIDCGDAEGPRTIASGLRAHYTAEQLTGRMVVVIANLKPVKMRGFLSKGMVLCAGSDDKSKVEFVDVPAGSSAGDRIVCAGQIPDGSVPDAQINLKSKSANPWGEIFPDLRTDNAGRACFKGTPMTVAGEVLQAPTLRDAQLS